ncbi:wax ester/triacylglycerol synthase family O-acyltransferase [Spongiibacter sp. KMU-158]|uniref:diacylglycerol O-acyltransferase n=1 Tax=Spongiibacter pelagi TaxID=2760804 RepID=A0A927C057_9GAMM|nr:wax ester/triacylglycerol synthase family O-acyltransferase [Spongiibacter pelagi]MBD2858810.1 wax ester/triacylglycerol synthase family O-acyltransferase [Spongiibacter pelagi]
MGDRKLSILDTSFLQLESAQTPMHVAGLLIFDLPEGAGKEFVSELVARFRGCKVFRPPWNYCLQRPGRLQFKPVLKENFDIDMEYHVRHLALPFPGGERELGQLISRIHSQRLDFRRPLWELHVIEGLENNRFAVYIKIHHCLADGVSATKLLFEGLSASANDPAQMPFWAAAKKERSKKPVLKERSKLTLPKIPNLDGAIDIAKEAGRTWFSSGDELVSLRSAPMTMLNQRIHGQRRFATFAVEMARIKNLAKAAECSLNDIVLALCGTVLREYLETHDALPRESLTTNIPVSLHKPGTREIKNDIALILATLGTNIADDQSRLEAIMDSTNDAKERLRALPDGAQGVFGSLALVPYTATVLFGLAGRIRPTFNIVVSNVPGPNETRYLFGAPLRHLYPVSIPTHGSAINFTCFSYDGVLNFGLTACRDTVPHMQQMAVGLGDALERYEAIYLK